MLQNEKGEQLGTWLVACYLIRKSQIYFYPEGMNWIICPKQVP